MKICVPVRIGECRALLRQNLDSRFDFGMERHVGWVIGYFFSMSYHSGDEVGLYYLLVFHKAMGFLSGVLVFIFALHHISGRCNLLCLCLFAKGKKSAGKIERNPSQFVDQHEGSVMKKNNNLMFIIKFLLTKN